MSGLTTNKKFAILDTTVSGFSISSFDTQREMAQQLMYQTWRDFESYEHHIQWLKNQVDEIEKIHIRDQNMEFDDD